MKVAAQISLTLFWLVSLTNCAENTFNRIYFPLNTTDYNVSVFDSNI